ncbi:sulfotransferase 6B1 [Denticeps clupeoides]|uniref:Sulfotransferase n=1 Tax=Denticeps clupeoides TaxID=299321 RepID=A0AAY4B1S8_9TELE|nr:sulfotransferase 6B1-like [Denticeps clupeoides]
MSQAAGPPRTGQTKMEMAKNMKDEDKFYRYDGVLYSSVMSPVENLEGLKSMQARPEDIVLVAYPKCGFTWVVGVMRKVMAASVGTKETSDILPLIEFHSPDVQKTVSQLPSPRFLGTHLHPDTIPASFMVKKTKMLVVFRNPKDTVVSYFHFMNKNPVLSKVTWDNFFSNFMSGDVAWGSYFDHAVAWDKLIDDPNVKIITYEELKEDLSEGIRQISKFFGLTITEEQVQAIADKSTFTAMSENSKNTHGKFGSVFFRKGEVGDWKNHFTEAQSRQMDEEFTRRLAGTRLGAKLKYDVYCR